MESAVVAFSGGVDSTLLLACAQRALGRGAVAFTAKSPSFTPRELDTARGFCEERGIEHVVAETCEFLDPEYLANTADRCYFCKRALIGRALEVADERGIRYLVEGTNASEIDGHRPGHRASEESERVVSPLLDEGFGEADVREASKELGLPTWDMPSEACLASRVPAGTAITEELIARIAAAEETLRGLGARQVRVRHHGEIARIEVGDDEIGAMLEHRGEIARALGNLGWRFVTMDLKGYRTGSTSV